MTAKPAGETEHLANDVRDALGLFSGDLEKARVSLIWRFERLVEIVSHEMLLVGNENAWLGLYLFSLLFADDVGRHHAAAGAYIREFGVGQTRKRRPDFAIEQERVEIHQLLGKLDCAVIS